MHWIFSTNSEIPTRPFFPSSFPPFKFLFYKSPSLPKSNKIKVITPPPQKKTLDQRSFLFFSSLMKGQKSQNKTFKKKHKKNNNNNNNKMKKKKKRVKKLCKQDTIFMFILILGGVVVVSIILNEFLENHDARPQQHDVLCGFLEQLVGFHRFFSTGDEVLQSFKLFTNLIIITALWFERVNRGAGASFSVVMWVSSSPSCYSLCGSFEGELVTVPSDCGHGNN